MPQPPRVLVVGHVTWDLFDGRRVAGGSVSYAARAAASMGIRALILAGAGPDAGLDALEGHDVRVVQTGATLTYRHEFVDGERRLVLVAAPGRPLEPADLPPDWRSPDIAIVCPLIDADVAPEFTALAREECALIGQGYQREAGEAGEVRVLGAPSATLLRACSARTSLFLSSEEVAGWPSHHFERVVAVCRRVAVTYGDRGTVVHRRDGVEAVPAMRVEPVDATGAGDVFATAFILALGHGEREAGRLAAAYAAAAVRTPGAGALPPRSEIEASFGRRLQEGRA